MEMGHVEREGKKELSSEEWDCTPESRIGKGDRLAGKGRKSRISVSARAADEVELSKRKEVVLSPRHHQNATSTGSGGLAEGNKKRRRTACTGNREKRDIVLISGESKAFDKILKESWERGRRLPGEGETSAWAFLQGRGRGTRPTDSPSKGEGAELVTAVGARGGKKGKLRVRPQDPGKDQNGPTEPQHGGKSKDHPLKV